MSRKANPTMIGAFVLGALILVIIIVLLLAGGNWFRERRQYIMYFQEVGQGLQVGAQAVFLGVRIGTVTEIRLGMDKDSRIMVPVTIEIEPHTVRAGNGEQINLQDQSAIKKLIDRGLRARLKTQSLLTGQLYVDLDFYPDKPAHFFTGEPNSGEIPTIPTTVEVLTTMLEDFPVKEFLADVAAIGASTNKILSSEAVQNIPVRLEATLASLESLTARLDAESEPLLTQVKADLVELQEAISTVQDAMTRVGRAAGGIEKLTDAKSPMNDNIKRAAEELAGAATSLRQLADEDSPTVQRLNMSLEEISRAARALRQLAETLEREPEAIIRGKQE